MNEQKTIKSAGLNWEFWIGHALFMASTVIGVYLAASAGFKIALQFEAIKYDKDSYYLRRSFLDEVKRNLQVVDEISNQTAQGNVYHRKPEAGVVIYPKLRFFVWDALKFSPQTLAMPSPIIFGVQNYYLQVNDLLDRADQRLLATRIFSEKLKMKTNSFKKKFVPIMEDDLAVLKKRLDAAGVKLY